MTFIPATCPSCGGNLQVPDDRDQVKCMYCGGNVIVRDAVRLASGANIDNLMELAKAAAAASNPKEAYDYYTRVLEHDPANAAAWVGKGEAAGWMSTLADFKTLEMTAAFNNAIKYTPDSDKQLMRKRCADIVNSVTTACYSIARKHVEEFVRLDNAWGQYLDRCKLLLYALAEAGEYDPDNTVTLGNVIHICEDNIRGLSFKDFNGDTKAVFLSDEYEAAMRAAMNDCVARMQKVYPSYTRPQVQRASPSWCFIASATVGSVNHPVLVTLRAFRDEYLVETEFGKVFIRWYYRHGPALAEIVRHSRAVRLLSYWIVVRPAAVIARSLLRKRWLKAESPERSCRTGGLRANG